MIDPQGGHGSITAREYQYASPPPPPLFSFLFSFLGVMRMHTSQQKPHPATDVASSAAFRYMFQDVYQLCQPDVPARIKLYETLKQHFEMRLVSRDEFISVTHWESPYVTPYPRLGNTPERPPLSYSRGNGRIKLSFVNSFFVTFYFGVMLSLLFLYL